MPIYTAHFRTDADYATHKFDAPSADRALALARAFYDEQSGDLMFQEYDGGHALNEIAVLGENGRTQARWIDGELRRRLAADDLLAALRDCIDCIAAPESPSPEARHRILQTARAAVAKAEGEGDSDA